MEPELRWWERAECLGMWWLFDRASEKGMANSREAKQAKAACLRCEVRQECLDDAIKNLDLDRIRAGLSPREIRKMMRARGFKIPAAFQAMSDEKKRQVLMKQ